eukprot:7796342-Alexandrium_andersonii.AAC.1
MHSMRRTQEGEGGACSTQLTWPAQQLRIPALLVRNHLPLRKGCAVPCNSAMESMHRVAARSSRA